MARTKRPKSVHVRVSDAEHWLVGELAERAGVTRSELVRSLVHEAAGRCSLPPAPVDAPASDDRQLEMDSLWSTVMRAC